MEVFIIALLIGLIPAFIAKNKGHNFVGWWLYGALIFIIALPHSIIVKPNNEELERQKLNSGMKKCPHCAEIIKGEAAVCRYCNNEVSSVTYHSIYKTCSKCNQKNRKDDFKCIKCGNDIFI